MPSTISLSHSNLDSASPAPGAGVLIINADDWGRDRDNTEHIRECVHRGTVSSVSAMVFMQDSERAASTARDSDVDAGLHLNFTTSFSQAGCAVDVREKQQKLITYLRSSRWAQVIFNPLLASTFEYVVRAQLDEFERLYGHRPGRIDGHHHMHLCANVVLQRLLPSGTIVRRNFSLQPGEKSKLNQLYRKAVDARLARRHRLTDFFFSLAPLAPDSRLQGILALARHSVVEVETHPVVAEEYRFLTEGGAERWAGKFSISRSFAIHNGG